MDSPQALRIDDLELEFQSYYLPCNTTYVDMSI